LLRKFKPEIALMGFGDNGHIALNEPGCGFFDDPQTVKVVRIDMKTKLQSFNNGTRKSLEGPDYGITMTLPALMKPKYKFCIVPFKTKAQAAYKAIFGDISEDCPASFIRNHENVVVFFDSESAALFPEVKN
jgi:glucosamine-6-phosphate deaminase